MAGQGSSRRELLQALALASAASVFPGFSRWSYALSPGRGQENSTLSSPDLVNKTYRPQFFSPGEYKDVEVLVDLILPATQDPSKRAGKLQPGAKEAGVAEFIDFMVFTDPSLQSPFRDGMRWLDHANGSQRPFWSLAPTGQTIILERLAYKAKHRETEKTGQQFFQLFRQYTVMGFYTTRAGLESLDYPGLAFYQTSPGCTHDGNPEHIGL